MLTGRLSDNDSTIMQLKVYLDFGYYSVLHFGSRSSTRLRYCLKLNLSVNFQVFVLLTRISQWLDRQCLCRSFHFESVGMM